MDDEDFEPYLKEAIENYAREKVTAGTWEREGAQEKAKEAFARLLPGGLHTKDQHLFKIIDEKTQKKVGIIWIGVNLPSEDIRGAFVWDFLVYPEFRGKGYGKGTMTALDEKARELGERRITLHVFGHNSAAIDLYGKAGYVTTDLIMTKELESGQ